MFETVEGSLFVLQYEKNKPWDMQFLKVSHTALLLKHTPKLQIKTE